MPGVQISDLESTSCPDSSPEVVHGPVPPASLQDKRVLSRRVQISGCQSFGREVVLPLHTAVLLAFIRMCEWSVLAPTLLSCQLPGPKVCAALLISSLTLFLFLSLLQAPL